MKCIRMVRADSRLLWKMRRAKKSMAEIAVALGNRFTVEELTFFVERVTENAQRNVGARTKKRVLGHERRVIPQRALTSEVFGDPPSGRSALDQLRAREARSATVAA